MELYQRRITSTIQAQWQSRSSAGGGLLYEVPWGDINQMKPNMSHEVLAGILLRKTLILLYKWKNLVFKLLEASWRMLGRAIIICIGQSPFATQNA